MEHDKLLAKTTYGPYLVKSLYLKPGALIQHNALL